MVLKMLAEYLPVEEDLLSNYVFENGFDVTPLQVVRAIDAMVVEQRERLASRPLLLVLLLAFRHLVHPPSPG